MQQMFQAGRLGSLRAIITFMEVVALIIAKTRRHITHLIRHRSITLRCLSNAMGRILYFSVHRPGNFGNYLCHFEDCVTCSIIFQDCGRRQRA